MNNTYKRTKQLRQKRYIKPCNSVNYAYDNSTGSLLVYKRVPTNSYIYVDKDGKYYRIYERAVT